MSRIATQSQFLGVLPSFPYAVMFMTIVDVRRELSLIGVLACLAEKKGGGRGSVICTVMEAWEDVHF